MHFSGGINRPPYETADGYLQTTEGCSHNTCLFCTYFKDQKFRKSTIEEIEADIKEIPATFGAPKRIFLQGAEGRTACLYPQVHGGTRREEAAAVSRVYHAGILRVDSNLKLWNLGFQFTFVIPGSFTFTVWCIV